jgi:hypothetical protein
MADDTTTPPAGDPVGDLAEAPAAMPAEDVTAGQVDRASAGDRAFFRLAVFGAVLIVAISVGFGIGRLTGGSGTEVSGAGPAGVPMSEDHTHAPSGSGEAAHDHGAGTDPVDVAAAPADAGGLSITAAGLTLVPLDTTFVAGRSAPLRFRIAGSGGAPVTTFAVMHDKPLHLIVVRRDLSGYQHLHPTMAADGTWSVDLTLRVGGTWRAYADFTALVDGIRTPATLGVDLTVPGDYAPVALPAPARQATTDGFTVSYQGTPSVVATQPLLVTVAGAGGPATLEPYLGAYGHLVVLREGDLGYVHVHPEPRLVDGAVKFWLAAPGPGRYRMFFDFQVGGAVRTAAFTTTVS